MIHNRHRLALLTASAACCAIAAPVHAQTRMFDISAQPAITAIPALGRQARVQIIAARAVTGELRLRGVKGSMTVDQALAIMFNGTDLVAQRTGPGTYAVVRRQFSPVSDAGRADAPGYIRVAQVQSAPVVDDGAAEAPATSPTSQSEVDIVVTAQRRAQSLQDVPISVTVAGGPALERQNITTLEQLSVQLPAVKISQTPASDQLYIRGVGSGLNPGFEQSVATFVDGVYRGRSRSSRAALFDVDRVEVLKGPQTTFFGNNAIAGAFNISTRKPGRDLRSNLRALYSPSDGEYNVEAGVDLPVTDALAVRLAGRLSGMNGYVYNANLDRNEPHMRDAIGRINLVWDNGGTFTSNLRVDAIRNRDRGTYSAELLNCPIDPALGIGPSRGQCAAYLAASGGTVDDRLNFRSSTGDSFFRYDAVEVAFSNDLELGSHKLSLISSYFDHDSKTLSNIIPVPLPGLYGTASPLPSGQNETLSQFTQEIRLSSPTGDTLDYMIGAYFLDGDVDVSNSGGFYFAPFGNMAGNGFPLNTPLTRITLTRQHERSFSFFGSATYHLTDALRVSGGLRYTRVRKTATRDNQAGRSDGPPDFGNFVPASLQAQQAALATIGDSILGFPSNKRIDDAFLPSAVIQYDVAPDVMLYGSYSKGFKAGGFSAFSRDTFEPERVNAYELGVKSRLFDRALTLNLAFFLSDYTNLQEASQVLVGLATRSIIGNSASSVSKGVELGASWRQSPMFSARADISYLDSHYKDYRDAPCRTIAGLTAGCVQDQSGAKRAYSPQWSGSVGATLTIPIGAFEFRIEPTVAFTSGFLTQSLNDPLYRQPGYAKADLRLGFGEKSRWEVAVIGKNLANKATASFRAPVPSSPGSVLALPERARSIAIQATFTN